MLRTYKLIWDVLTSTERRNFLFLLLLIVFLAVFETLGVAVILPFLTVVSNPDILSSNEFLTWLYELSGATTPLDFTLRFGYVVLAIIICSMMVRAGVTYLMYRFALMRSYSLSSRLLSGYLNQPYPWFLAQNSSELGQSLLSEVDLIIRESLLPAVVFVFQSLVAIFVVSFLFYVEPGVAIGAFLAIGGTYVCVYLILRSLIERVGQRRFDSNRARFRVAQEATGGIKEVKVMSLEHVFLNQFRSPALRMAKSQISGLIIGLMPRFALEAVAFGGLIFFILLMISLRGLGVAEILPILGLLGMAATKLFPALQQMYQQVTKIRMSRPALEKLHHDLTTLTRPSKSTGDIQPIKLEKEISLEKLSFAYPGTDIPVLEDLSISVPVGSTIGLVGGTGAGKTTMVDIILGLLQPDDGVMRIDGRELEAKEVPSWQANIGYVPQSIFLSDDTLEQNIAFGVPAEEIDQSKIITASKAAQLHDFVMSELPEHYDTVVGERGVRLSGGQRQRIGIARALYRDPGLLILDEATSALDNITERQVMKAVHGLGAKKTIIMIAHRLSTVEQCDNIFFMKKGKVEAQGTFKELVAGNDEFKELTQSA